MPTDTFIPSLILSIPGLLGTIALGIYTVRNNRKSSKESNTVAQEQTDIQRFEAILDGYEKSRKSDAERIAGLEAERRGDAERIQKLEETVAQLTAQAKLQALDVRRIKSIVQQWIARIWEEWPHQDSSMPMPSADELLLLEITLPQR